MSSDRVCRWEPKKASEQISLDANNISSIIECVHFSAFCNSTIECHNGADELFCAAISCDDPRKFHCGGIAGECIDMSLRCDGKHDCFDGIDEQNCQHKLIHCKNSQFLCVEDENASYDANPDGRCVDLERACDRDMMSCLKDGHAFCYSLCQNSSCPERTKCRNSTLGAVLVSCVAVLLQFDII